MSHKYGRSPLWVHNNETRVTKDAVKDLAEFKSAKINFKLALWDPNVNGVRYLKALIYNLAGTLSEDNWTRLRNIRHRNIGKPTTVRYGGETVCMDYLQAVLELDFIAEHVDLDGMTVLEIGAGYGRTAHTLLSNHDIREYHVIDLENSLVLAREYLRTVLDPEQMAKIRFIPVEEVDSLPRDVQFDLCINIDSFAEMDPDTVRNYLAFIGGRCGCFYTKNPVGKYLDKSLDGHSQGDEVVAYALRTGPLRDVIDVHDSQAVEAQASKFVSAYRPADGWRCVADSRAAPWSYYWQALYQSDRSE
jgi:putative sugar O-methyltransferase